MPTSPPTHQPATPPVEVEDFDFDEGFYEATEIAEALDSQALDSQALDLYLRFDDALIAQDAIAAISVLEELRALRDTMAEWRKMEEMEERTRRLNQGHY